MCAAQAEQRAAQASPPPHKEWLLHFRNFRKRKSHSVNHAGRC